MSYALPVIKLANKTIIITGANQGIGLKVAKHFFLKGSNLILCARNKKKLLSVKKKLVTKFQNKLILEQLDISKKRQVDKFYKNPFPSRGKIYSPLQPNVHIRVCRPNTNIKLCV